MRVKIYNKTINMNITKRNSSFALLIALYFVNCSAHLEKPGNIALKNNIPVDTIQGYFLYEANVPLMCYSRFDQIEQGNNLIFFDSSINKKEIQELYTKGVFIYSYPLVIQQYINKKGSGLPQNKTAVWDFERAISYFHHQKDSLYNRTLYYDKKNILSYKKICAKFACINLGKLKQLIPKTANYKCCYSNTSEMINTFFIIDVFEFKLY